MGRPPRVLQALAAALVAVALSLGVVVVIVRTRSEPADPTPATQRVQGTPVTYCDDKVGTVSDKPQWDSPPTMQIDPTKSYRATIETTLGPIVVDLDPRSAPATVNNFVFLAGCGFYDGTVFHRVARGFVIQGGDPSGTGRGGPGYTFPDELPPQSGYPLGSVAMANSGAHTNGSQFFIVTGDGASGLPNKYSRFGTVVGGLEVAQAIEALPIAGGGQDGRPVDPPVMTSVTVAES